MAARRTGSINAAGFTRKLFVHITYSFPEEKKPWLQRPGDAGNTECPVRLWPRTVWEKLPVGINGSFSHGFILEA
jgi:hypothetical protein